MMPPLDEVAWDQRISRRMRYRTTMPPRGGTAGGQRKPQRRQVHRMMPPDGRWQEIAGGQRACAFLASRGHPRKQLLVDLAGPVGQVDMTYQFTAGQMRVVGHLDDIADPAREVFAQMVGDA